MLAAIARSQGWTWIEAGALALPLALIAALLSLSAWFLCRALPLGRTTEGLSSRGVAWGMAAVLVGGIWSGLAWLLACGLVWIPALSALPRKVSAALPVLTGLGILLYLAAVVVYTNFCKFPLSRGEGAKAKGSHWLR
jgi:hypothetical protein